MQQHCLILGGGLSGKAAERLAASLGFSTAILSDSPGLDADAAVAEADLIVTSPGMKPLVSPLWQAAMRRAGKGQCEFISELEFGFRNWPGKLLAITGTNGKTTTTELTAALLTAAGVEARTAGNIGLPLSELAADLREGKLSPDALPVVEVSSFQLERCDTFAPFAAALLNLESDHVDRYAGGFAEYAAVKQRIFDRVAPENRVYGLSMDSPVPRRVTLYGDALMIDEEEVLIDLGNTALSAVHNRENLAAAVELCLRVLPLETVLSPEFRLAIHMFQPGRHRQELVCEKNGVRYVNDSKATNPASTVAALRAIPGTVVLLLGGLDKEMDFSPLAPFADRIRFAVLYGECRAKIAAALPESIPTADCGMEFERAIRTACDHAQPGDTVLLAPACASMDMFRDYKERGDRFAAFVKQL
ncbi:UDP-N-acetylmuramoyl-L-alanine--D-glutamate ligase [uncultured Victivallis sp.]|uniref:UDP-N-acetylmuramoyl-L-alanine--D-glutamate ligase n=1 Tax=uncultured Victivallis sp. TaxID=354118 RepID=UPI0025F2CA84|nr:UDP-N-acetylmuramoyl-L-alanine--D-glutamate ligase [uncultured Victivallis sp.]